MNIVKQLLGSFSDSQDLLGGLDPIMKIQVLKGQLTPKSNIYIFALPCIFIFYFWC